MNLHSPTCSKGRFHDESACNCEVAVVVNRITSWPELNATKSRDYGRGYAHAIRDVVGLLT